MDPSAAVRLLRRRWWLPVVMGFGVAAIAVAVAGMAGERFRSAATMRLRTPGAVSTESVRPDSVDYLDRLQTTYADLVTSGPFRDEVQARAGGSEPLSTYVDLRAGSELFTIGVETTERRRARPAAEAAAALLVEQVRNQDLEMSERAGAAVGAQVAASFSAVESLRAELAELTADRGADATRVGQVRAEIAILLEEATRQEAALASWRMGLIDRSNLLSVLGPATAPVRAGQVPPAAAAVVGMFVGSALGVGAALVIGLRRRVVDSGAEVAAAGGAPVLAIVPAGHRPDELLAALAPAALALVAAAPEPTFLLAPAAGSSACPALTAGLAGAFAQLDRRVVVVGGPPGSAEALGATRGADAQRDDDGRLRPEPTAITGVQHLQLGHGRAGERRLSPPRLQKVVTGLREDFDVVLVEGEALDAGPDLLVQASAVPDIVVSVELGHQTSGDVERTVRQLEAVGAGLLGFVALRPPARPARSRRAR